MACSPNSIVEDLAGCVVEIGGQSICQLPQPKDSNQLCGSFPVLLTSQAGMHLR